MTKAIRFFDIIVVISVVFSVANFQAQAATPVGAIERSWCLFRSVGREIEKVDVRVKYQSGNVDEKSLVRWMSFDPNGVRDEVAIKILKPKIEEGTKLLVWRNIGGENNIWLEMPSWTKERPVSPKRKDRFFVGTDFTFMDTEQLIGENTENYDYIVVGESDEYWTIESRPKKSFKNSVYYKRIIVVDKQTLAYLRVEYYKKDGKNGDRLEKVLTNYGIQQFGEAWRPSQTVIENLNMKRKTVYTVIGRELGAEAQIPQWGLDKRFFLKR